MKYIKIPVEVEAIQFLEFGDDPDVVKAFKTPNGIIILTQLIDDGEVEIFAIKTLEGWHEVTPGDYIITGVEGERYPIKNAIFKKTYKPAPRKSARMSCTKCRELFKTHDCEECDAKPLC